MVAPLTPAEIRTALTVWGIPFIEEPGWTTRGNRAGWGDVAGFMWHHTGDDAPDSADLKVVRDGHAGLPGPLCNFGLRDDGKVHLVAAGGANHAGGGDSAVLASVRAASYGSAPPAPRFTHADLVNGKAGAVIGNPVFYGVESFYYRNLTSAARAMMPRLAAAIIWALDRKDKSSRRWSAKAAIGHREWQRGKVDPRLDGGDTCSTLRDETQAYLNAGPTGAGPNQEDPLSQITPEQLKDLAAAGVLGAQIGRATTTDGSGKTVPLTVGIVLDRVYGSAKAAADRDAATSAQIKALVGAVAALSKGEAFDEAKLLESVRAATAQGIVDAGRALASVEAQEVTQ